MTAQPLRVLVVDDDPDLAEFVRTALHRRLDAEVHVLHDAVGVTEAVATFRPDVLVTDVELPGASGLDLLVTAREVDPDLPVVVMTAHASVDYAVRALRDRADEFLQKPLSAVTLAATVERLAAAARQVRALRPVRSVLAIGAHPDDVEIGIGGILSAHAEAGDRITVLTLSRGGRGGAADDRQHESLAAAELVGARLFLEDLTDTAIPHNDPTVGIIERVVAEVEPAIVYTHTRHDRHQDHRAVHEATLVATRRVDTVLCYQSPSATVDFRPSRFVTIDGHLDRKLALLACFASQAGIRDYLDPEFVRATARYWSRFGIGRTVEPLEVVRDATAIGLGDKHPTTARLVEGLR